MVHFHFLELCLRQLATPHYHVLQVGEALNREKFRVDVVYSFAVGYVDARHFTDGLMIEEFVREGELYFVTFLAAEKYVFHVQLFELVVTKIFFNVIRLKVLISDSELFVWFVVYFLLYYIWPRSMTKAARGNYKQQKQQKTLHHIFKLVSAKRTR